MSGVKNGEQHLDLTVRLYGIVGGFPGLLRVSTVNLEILMVLSTLRSSSSWVCIRSVFILLAPEKLLVRVPTEAFNLDLCDKVGTALGAGWNQLEIMGHIDGRYRSDYWR